MGMLFSDGPCVCIQRVTQLSDQEEKTFKQLDN